MRRAAILATAMMLVTTVPVAAAGFETPDAAVRAYLEGVAQADLGSVREATAVDEVTQGYRFDQQVERVKSFVLSMPGPVHHPFFAEIQHAEFTGRLLGQSRVLAYSLLAPDLLGDALDYRPINPVDAAWATDLMAELDPSRLSSLVVTDIALPHPEIYGSERNLTNMARIASINGADELTDRVVLFVFEDDLYAVGFMLLRYGDEWKVSSQSSPISGLPLTGIAQPTTIDEFTELTSES